MGHGAARVLARWYDAAGGGRRGARSLLAALVGGGAVEARDPGRS